MTININDILKALANEKTAVDITVVENPGNHFTSDKCDVNTQGVCVGLIEKKSAYRNRRYHNIYCNCSALT